MRIVLTGAGGSGKTTTISLLNDFSKEMKLQAPISVARIIYEKNNLTEETVSALSIEDAWKLQQEILHKKIILDAKLKNTLCDRSILDHYVYCLLYCHKLLAHVDDCLHLETVIKNHMKELYDFVFYIPFGQFFVEPKKDVRNNSFSWQTMVDSMILGFLTKWKVKYHTLEGEASERAEKLAYIVRSEPPKGGEYVAKQ